MIRLVLVVLLSLFALPALAQAVVPDPTVDLAAFLQLAGELWAGARWAPLIALAVVAVVAVLRKWGTTWIPWFGTRTGGLALAVGAAVAGALAQALLVPGAIVWAQVVFTALVAAAGAMGLHAGAKNTVRVLVRSPADPDPLAVDCPVCGKPAGTYCYPASGESSAGFCLGRVDAVTAEDATKAPAAARKEPEQPPCTCGCPALEHPTGDGVSLCDRRALCGCQGYVAKAPGIPGAAAALTLLLALPLASGCAALRSNSHDLVCGIRDACVVCEGELVQDGVSRAVEVRYCEDAMPAAAVVAE